MNFVLACTGSIGSTKIVELVKSIQQKNNDVSLLRSLKVGPRPSIKAGFFCFNETSWKMVRNAFYFTLKVLSFFRFSIFFLTFLAMQENGLIRKIRLISKLMASQTGKQIIMRHILPNISRSKGNQIKKFSQLIEYKATAKQK